MAGFLLAILKDGRVLTCHLKKMTEFYLSFKKMTEFYLSFKKMTEFYLSFKKMTLKILSTHRDIKNNRRKLEIGTCPRNGLGMGGRKTPQPHRRYSLIRTNGV